ncbi:phenylalanine--tRNA ligase subunit beta [Lachnoclostridium sp. An131]|uniref:phenylalanine--tRNA ligase subunit beta n=1 Tax=Lachnoclostridium sp. An131 TaxID=1965555 RepID=UPI000B3A9A6C|nr:phenylalanine--tRNA ligase subunit beta [Lachnoclostridium sp. An131]OUQ24400.1 phenylalanine--tRNA ligase subunit beta [Lachnoclostridium sp. An131]
MKLSLSWIKDYVQIPEDMDLKKLAYDLTMSTVEVEDVEYLARRFDNVLVGVIEKIEPHPNADKLRVCKVDIGGGEIKDIVCGGINLKEGMRVAVSCPGAVVRWHGEGEPVVIKNSKLRGVESYGMICASDEIGLGELFPASQEAEILDLSAFEVPAGTSLADALDMNDVLLEIDNKSMTNRPDLWGHYGIAREIAALYDLPLKKIEPYTADVQSDFKVEINDPDRCTRYIGVEMSGVEVKPSPYQMQNRIWKAGMRPINALVDITNYVMLATGNPTHAFDADNITDHIVVRHAVEGEKLILLNDHELTLCADDLVITDSEGPVALAGVMGGAKDSILPKTRRVILEVANFESTGIRRTALRYDTRTEASSRYEKAVDPERCEQALALSMQYFQELYPELTVTGFCDKYVKKLERAQIDVSLAWLAKRLGKNLSNEVIQKKLELLGFDVEISGDNMHVTAPTWRSTGDISIKDDVMEEVARLYGYDNFEATSFTTTFEGAINQKDQDLLRRIKEYLAIRCGMQEVYTYPWMNDVFVNAVLQSTQGVLRLSTPPAPDLSYIRSSLLPNLCEAVVKNERYFNDFAIFEEAQVFFDRNYTAAYDETELLPEQKRHIGAAFASSVKDITELFREAKGVLEYMPRYTHMEGFEFRKEEKPVWADNVVWMNIFHGDEKIGDMGLVAKKVSMDCGIKNLSVMLFELDVTKLVPLKSRTNRFTHLAEYPETDYDISMLFDSDAAWADIYDAIMGQKKASALLKDAAFVDEYRGKQIPAGKKSVTIRLTIGSSEKTLTSQEIESAANQVMKKLGKKMGAELRTQ